MRFVLKRWETRRIFRDAKYKRMFQYKQMLEQRRMLKIAIIANIERYHPPIYSLS